MEVIACLDQPSLEERVGVLNPEDLVTQALIVVDAQNEFSTKGKRPVPITSRP